MILDRFRLTDRVAVVTGAGRGIGAATAVAPAEAGADVVVSARTTSQLDEVAARIEAAGRRASVVPADLSEPDNVAALAAAAKATFGRLDVVSASPICEGASCGSSSRRLEHRQRRPARLRRDCRPDLELVGVWVSNPEKEGRDAGELAGLGRRLGVAATTDAKALIALVPDCIVHTAMADHRLFDALEDQQRFLRAGINVVSSGPVFLQFPDGVMPDEMMLRCVRRLARVGHPSG